MSMSKLLNMIRKNTSIWCITIIERNNELINVNGDELLRLASEHPETTQLELPNCLLKGETAIHFFRVVNSIKRFQFRVRIKKHSAYEHSVSKLDSEWAHEYWIDENDNT